ncbi:MAG: carbon-nitrogen hydrolase family protein [Gammaproteobacteria bacterium]|uniref:Nitrilase n=1 Tax=uncultured organism TaxID=155900 RepID=Q6RWK9_9ZZZZ|nr:nitrilase [uncultured organism]MCW8846046.1 carbon-nitrogen hydrolase family protein [Gammaproteobacteria bacterium]
MIKVAIAQVAPVVLDKARTIEKAVGIIRAAAQEGIELLVFPETFIPTYPAWVWRLRPGTDYGLSEELHALLLDNSVDMESKDLEPLQAVAAETSMTVVIGMNERDGRFSRGTIYNALVVIGPGGTILNRHRKLMPTNPERMVWGMGDASGLKVVEMSYGRLGGLICWENFMPLARYGLYAQGVEIYVAPTYDQGDGWVGSMQHIAREGRCWVLSAGTLLRGSDFLPDFPGKTELYPDDQEWVNPGGSVIVAPGGEIVAGPMYRDEGLLVCELDATLSVRGKRSLDVAGHYSRPDLFELEIDGDPLEPIEWD